MVDKLQWITWSIIPLVYDESLSYVELLNKVVAKLNEVIEANNDFSGDVKDAVNEWLTANGEKALEEAVNAAVNSYMQTGDFKTILVNALATHSDVISDAASEAAAAWLNDTTGQDVVKTETDATFANYVKSDEFAKLVESFVTDLDDIKRGQSLDIKQMNAFGVYSADVQLTSAKMSSDYSVNKTIAYLSLSDVGALLGYGIGADLSILDDRVVLSKPLYLGGEGGANQKQIKRVADPTEDADAATKKYVDDAVKSGGGGTSGKGYVQFVYCYQTSKTEFACSRSFEWIKTQINSGSTVRLNLENKLLDLTGDYSNIEDQYEIVFTNAQGYPANTTVSQTEVDTEQVEFQTVIIDSNDNVIVLGNNITLSDYVRTDGTNAFTSSQSMGNNTLRDLAAPFNDTDAANKAYVDAHGGFNINKITYSADGSYTCDYGFDQMSDPSRYAVLISGEWQTDQPLMCYYTGLTSTVEHYDGSVMTAYVYEGFYSPDYRTLYKRTVFIGNDGTVLTDSDVMFQNELGLANSFLIGTVTGDSVATYECDMLYSDLLQGINEGKKVMIALDGVVYVTTPKSVGDNVLTFERLYFSGDWLYKAELTITSSEEISVVATSYNITSSHVPVWYSDYLGSSATGSTNYLGSDYMPKQTRFAISGVSGAITVQFTVPLYSEDGSNYKSITFSAEFSTDGYIDFIVVDAGLNGYRLYRLDGTNVILCGTSKYPYIGSLTFTTTSSINASIFSLR